MRATPTNNAGFVSIVTASTDDAMQTPPTLVTDDAQTLSRPRADDDTGTKDIETSGRRRTNGGHRSKQGRHEKTYEFESGTARSSGSHAGAVSHERLGGPT